MKRISSIIVALISIFIVSSCNSGKEFRVAGTIAGADNQTIYLEYLGLAGTEVVDSVALGRDGKYSFSHELPEYPDFYRLRLGKQVIPFVVDTLPTDLTITSDVQSFATSYSISGDQASAQMREVWLALLDANVALSKLVNVPSDSLYTVRRDSIIGGYKSVAERFIFSNPQSPVAYFALFQQVDGNLVFNLYDEKDSKAFAAIANVYQAFQAENPRTKHLYDLALRSIAVVREQKRMAQAATMPQDSTLLAAAAKPIGYIDFSLPDTEGNQVSLSAIVAQGNSLLLAFSTMQANWSQEFNAALAQLYSRYSAKGLKIVQVSLDTDPHIWITSAKDLPWTSLIDRDGAYSRLVGLYNLPSLPSLFLIKNNGDELHRIGSLDQISSLL